MKMSLFSKPDLEKKLREAQEEISVLKARLEEFSRHNARGAGRKGRMTDADKEAIARLRGEGMSYNKIAKALNLPVGTVYNYGKSLENSLEKLEEKIKRITRALETDSLPDTASLDLNHFLERSKYRNLMNSIQSKSQK